MLYIESSPRTVSGPQYHARPGRIPCWGPDPCAPGRWVASLASPLPPPAGSTPPPPLTEAASGTARCPLGPEHPAGSPPILSCPSRGWTPWGPKGWLVVNMQSFRETPLVSAMLTLRQTWEKETSWPWRHWIGSSD